MSANLRQNVLRSNIGAQQPTDSDDEWINVQSGAATPGGVLSRPQSPTPGGLSAKERRRNPRDPLRVLPTEISQKIFGRLGIRDLARCARVSKKWNASQTINYVWFQHYRRENFQDESLPPGKWTKRESKENWRKTYMLSVSTREAEGTPYSRPYRSASGYSTPSGSGYRTPKEVNEERWEREDETKPSKVEMREMYKELGGRKSKAKNKVGVRNVGGLGGEHDYD